MFVSVSNSNVQPIAASFDIKALGKDSTGAVIEITDYINGDNDVLHFGAEHSKASYAWVLFSIRQIIYRGVRSFPINVEIKTVKTYCRTPAAGNRLRKKMQLAVQSGHGTEQFMVLLPKVPMQPRYLIPGSGYFAFGYTDYDANPQGVKNIRHGKTLETGA